MSSYANLPLSCSTTPEYLTAVQALVPASVCISDAWEDRARQLEYTLRATWVFAEKRGLVPRSFIDKLNREICALAHAIQTGVPRHAHFSVMVQLADLLATLQDHAQQFQLSSVGALEALAWRLRTVTAADGVDGPQRRWSLGALPSACMAAQARASSPARVSSQLSVDAATPQELWPLMRPKRVKTSAASNIPKSFGHAVHFARASKIPIFPEKYGPAIMEHIDWPQHWRARLLVSPVKNRYIFSHTVSQGAFGKIRCAIDTATLIPWIIKEFRLRPHADPKSLSALGQLRTHPCLEMDIAEELQLTARLTDGLLVAREAMRCGSKILVVMPKMVGDVKRLITIVPEVDRRNMTRMVFAKMVLHLDHIHQTDHLHGDIKLENVLHSATGQVVLSDYGGARACLGRTRYRWPVTSTYPAPEMMRGVAYTKRIDTWSLGATVPDFFNPSLINPFAVSARTGDANDTLTTFAVWRKRIVRGRYARLNRIDDTTIWGRFLLPLREQDPTLCRFVLRRLLHPNPRRRADMPEVLRFCDRRLTVADEPRQAMLALHAHAATGGMQYRVTQALQRVAWWQGYRGISLESQ